MDLNKIEDAPVSSWVKSKIKDENERHIWYRHILKCLHSKLLKNVHFGQLPKHISTWKLITAESWGTTRREDGLLSVLRFWTSASEPECRKNRLCAGWKHLYVGWNRQRNEQKDEGSADSCCAGKLRVLNIHRKFHFSGTHDLLTKVVSWRGAHQVFSLSSWFVYFTDLSHKSSFFLFAHPEELF